MKKLMLSAVLVSSIAFAKESGNPFFRAEEDAFKAQQALPPDNPIDDDPATDPVPVNTYVPFLLAAAIGIAAYYGNKKMKFS